MIKEDLITLISAYHNAGIGIINDVDLDNEKITVILDNKNEVECDLFFPYCHIYNKDKTAWGHISYPSKGDFAIIGMYKGQPTILQWINGKENLEDIYKNGKLKINRIKDSEDEDDVLDEKLKIGEILLRSIGLGDLFFDKFGNIILDTHKECMIRIGDRTNNIISTPELTLRIGKVKDDFTGEEKKDIDNKKIKLELIFNTDNQLLLNEDGQWTVENKNTSIVLQPDGKIVINGGSVEIARNGDDVAIDTVLKNWLNTHVHATAAVGPPVPPTVLFTGTKAGDISEGNSNFLSD